MLIRFLTQGSGIRRAGRPKVTLARPEPNVPRPAPFGAICVLSAAVEATLRGGEPFPSLGTVAIGRSVVAPVMDDELQVVGIESASEFADPHGACELGRDAAWRELNARVLELGFRHWAFSAVPSCYKASHQSPLRVTTYPRPHVRACVEQQLYVDCPGLSFALEHAETSEFSLVRGATKVTNRLQRLLELNRRFAVTRGMVIPLHNVLGIKAVLALAFEASPSAWAACWRERQQTLTQHARDFNRVLLARHAPAFSRPFAPKLTARQLEIARLLACGQSTEQVADSLAISVHTLNPLRSVSTMRAN